MKTFLILYFIHLLLDWSLQDEMTKNNKSKYLIVLYTHCTIWSLGISIALMYFGLFEWWKLAMLFFGHFAMDYWKCHRLYKKWPLRKFTYDEGDDAGCGMYYQGTHSEYKYPLISDITSLYIDQAFHVIQVLICLI